MSTKAIRDAILTALEAVSVTDTTKTLAPRVPRGAQAYEGYILYTFPTSTVLSLFSGDMIQSRQTWLVRVLSPMLNTDLDALREDYIYDYGDSVRATLYKDPTLGGSTALDEIAIERERYIIPFDFAGNKVAMYELTLTVLLTEQREGC